MFGCWWAVLLKMGSSFLARTTNAHVALATIRTKKSERDDDVVFLIGGLYSLLLG